MSYVKITLHVREELPLLINNLFFKGSKYTLTAHFCLSYKTLKNRFQYKRKMLQHSLRKLEQNMNFHIQSQAVPHYLEELREAGQGHGQQ